MKPPGVHVSIVVPTYNRPEALAPFLESIARLDYPRGDFELIVVDDGSLSPIECPAAPFRVRLVRQTHAGPAAARNRGAAEAEGDLLAFLDDDCRPRPDWLSAMTSAWRANALVAGSTRNACGANRYAVFNQSLVDAVREWFDAHVNSLVFRPSNNLLVETEAYRAMGGFSTAFPLAGAEDREFTAQWTGAGGELIDAGNACIDHYHPQSFLSFLRMHFRYGLGAAIFHRLRGTHPAQFAAAGLYQHFWRRTRSPVLLLLSQLATAAGYGLGTLRR